MTIGSFGNEDTEQLFRTGEAAAYPAEIRLKALQRMERLDTAVRLDYLAHPIGMRLRKAPGFGPGFYRVYVGRGWWVIFRWEHPDCFEVLLSRKLQRN